MKHDNKAARDSARSEKKAPKSAFSGTFGKVGRFFHGGEKAEVFAALNKVVASDDKGERAKHLKMADTWFSQLSGKSQMAVLEKINRSLKYFAMYVSPESHIDLEAQDVRVARAHLGFLAGLPRDFFIDTNYQKTGDRLLKELFSSVVEISNRLAFIVNRTGIRISTVPAFRNLNRARKELGFEDDGNYNLAQLRMAERMAKRANHEAMSMEECIRALESGTRDEKGYAVDSLFKMAKKGEDISDAIPALLEYYTSKEGEHKEPVVSMTNGQIGILAVFEYYAKRNDKKAARELMEHPNEMVRSVALNHALAPTYMKMDAFAASLSRQDYEGFEAALMEGLEKVIGESDVSEFLPQNAAIFVDSVIAGSSQKAELQYIHVMQDIALLKYLSSEVDVISLLAEHLGNKNLREVGAALSFIGFLCRDKTPSQETVSAIASTLDNKHPGIKLAAAVLLNNLEGYDLSEHLEQLVGISLEMISPSGQAGSMRRSEDMFRFLERMRSNEGFVDAVVSHMENSNTAIANNAARYLTEIADSETLASHLDDIIEVCKSEIESEEFHEYPVLTIGNKTHFFPDSIWALVNLSSKGHSISAVLPTIEGKLREKKSHDDVSAAMINLLRVMHARGDSVESAVALVEEAIWNCQETARGLAVPVCGAKFLSYYHVSRGEEDEVLKALDSFDGHWNYSNFLMGFEQGLDLAEKDGHDIANLRSEVEKRTEADKQEFEKRKKKDE